MSLSGFPYHGHFVRLEPVQNKERWEAQVVVEVHAKGEKERISYHDHVASYASRDLGRRMVESFTVPAYGEGDYQEPA